MSDRSEYNELTEDDGRDITKGLLKECLQWCCLNLCPLFMLPFTCFCKTVKSICPNLPCAHEEEDDDCCCNNCC